MKIPESTLRKWKSKREWGTISEIANKTKVSRQAITHAFKGYASENTVNVINEYFNIK